MVKKNYYRSADLPSRCLANVIDSLFSLTIALILIYLAHYIGKYKIQQNIRDKYEIVAVIIIISLSTMYPILIEPILVARKGGSLGKLLLKMKVITMNDKKELSLKRSFLRSFIKFFIFYHICSFVGIIDVLFAFRNKKRQTAHDYLLDTWVVKGEKSLLRGSIVFIMLVILDLALIIGLLLIIKNL